MVCARFIENHEHHNKLIRGIGAKFGFYAPYFFSSILQNDSENQRFSLNRTGSSYVSKKIPWRLTLATTARHGYRVAGWTLTSYCGFRRESLRSVTLVDIKAPLSAEF